MRRACYNGAYGGMAEWSIAPVLKTGVSQGTVSSNLTPSALSFHKGTVRIAYLSGESIRFRENAYTVPMKSFSGTVIRGSQRAASLGYPTINLGIDNMNVDGIFASTVTIDGREHIAAAFADPLRGLLEAYILDITEDFYGREAKIVLHKKIRRNQHFATDELLKDAIASDVKEVRAYFSHI